MSTTPGTSPNASLTRRGMMSTLAQAFAGAKTFADLLTASVGVLTSLVRAAAAALVLRSDVGALSTHVAVKVGTSVADGSTHASAKLLAGYTGLGGTEVQKFSFDKSGILNLAGALYFNRSIVDTGVSGFPSQWISTGNQGLLIDTTVAIGAGAPLFLFRTFGDNKARVMGNGEFEGLVAGAGIVLRSPDGTRYRITVANGGALSVAPA